MNLKFRYACQGATYGPSLSFIIDKISFHENKEKRITLQKIVKLLNSMHEVSKVEIIKKYEGRRIIDAILKIHPSDSFIITMIENNKLTKRSQNTHI
ncbi:hypothetical protein KO527_10735 [Pseudoalteromonas sp. C2R02]|uniref:hypothetical protein n=1 Tax=Pseudoalteromonas sp. C2R02 TaxID=2841565 RepID=UPI001C091DB5|nr:hypothetical protein [Pseudoalteromonas sp. C2R02]MBU2969822.1 hypothetical protein [Pseudoalteromonas sp. C2R02]